MITLREIMGNIKKGQSALSVRAIMNELERVYQRLIRNIAIVGCDKDSNSTTVYLTMPSESRADKNYIIAVWCNTNSKMTLDTNIKVYSNSPSFLFNFTYVFYKKGSLLFPEKYAAIFKEQPAKMRNPFNTIGFDKHVFAAIRYISDYKIPRIIGEYEGRPIPAVPSIRVRMNRSTGKMQLAD